MIILRAVYKSLLCLHLILLFSHSWQSDSSDLILPLNVKAVRGFIAVNSVLVKSKRLKVIVVVSKILFISQAQVL